MATTVSYKGNTIATVSNQTKTLTTSGKYMEADVVITDTPATKDWVILVSNNLHDSSTDVANYYINHNGVLESYSGWSATDYISVNPNTWYRILSGPGNNWNAFYDSSKNPITNYMAVYIGSEDNERSVSLLKSPPNAYYLRISETTSKVTKVDIREADFNMPIGNVSITSNGTVNVSQYETATINVEPTYTATLTSTGSSSGCYVTYNGTKYYTSGNTFTFHAGDTLTTTQVGNQGGYVEIDNVEVSTSTNYSYTLPSSDISITLHTGSTAYVSITTSGSSGMNVQAYADHDLVNSGSYIDTDVALTVAKSGTYTISWMGWRNTTSGTSGSQLYKNGTAVGTPWTSFYNSYGQHVILTGQSLNQGDELVVRARSRNTSYYMGVGNLIIIQTA